MKPTHIAIAVAAAAVVVLAWKYKDKLEAMVGLGDAKAVGDASNLPQNGGGVLAPGTVAPNMARPPVPTWASRYL